MESLFVFAALTPWKSLVGLFTKFLEWLFELTMTLGVPSYVLAILIFTIIIKLVTQPLMNKQMRSTRRMQQLNPQIEDIKRRYPNDKNRQSQATMELYKKYNVKPMAGCLPLLIQMPVLIALYQGIYAIANEGAAHAEYFNITVFGRILSLGDPDPTGWVMGLVVAAASFLQQFLTTANRKDKTQLYMLIAMPLMFFFMMRRFPLMMGFYWTFYSIIGALIFLPLRLIWNKKDKEEAEAMRQAMEKEEEDRRRKKEQARVAAMQRAEERRKKALAKKGDKTAAPQPEVNYFEMLDDPDYVDDVLDDEQLEAEKEFRSWLRGQGVAKVRDKKMRLHPWSSADEVVSLCFMTNRTEVPLSDMKARYDKYQQQAQAQAQAQAMFSFGKKKKK